MDCIDAILTRRSIRKYREEPVSDELIRELLAAAMAAPSAGNQQPWHFVVVKDRGRLEQVSTIHPYVTMAAKAPAAVLVCGDPSLEKFPGYWVQDCAAATQNLLLAIHGKGLGGVWTGIYPMKDRMEHFSRLFKLPEHVIPFALVILGYPNQEMKPENRYKKERVHWERWDESA